VFVTGCNDPATIERIHEQVPDAPVTKPEYRKGLANAVAEVMEDPLPMTQAASLSARPASLTSSSHASRVHHA
jgi:hypothetical protein